MARPGPPSAVLLGFLVLAFNPDCQGYKPLIHPNVPERQINEGEPLEITCTSIGEINMIYPEDDDILKIVTSEHEIIPGDPLESSMKLKFRRENTVFGDTGWYGCADAKAEVKGNDYNDPNVSWIYVYVRSNSSAFVQGEEMQSIVEVVGSTVILPCRPTSPAIHVSLMRGGLEVGMDEKWSFDSKVGFILQRGVASDTDYYICQVEQDNFSAQILLFVKLLVRAPINPPIILTEGLQHVIKGSSLHVKCTIILGSDNNYAFFWITPRNSTSRKILPPVRKSVGTNDVMVTSELVEDEVTYDDDGEYVCRVKSYTDLSETKVYIHVYDPNLKYINLTSPRNHFRLAQGASVVFLANVSGHPVPKLTWSHPDGTEIKNSSKMMIKDYPTKTILNITKVEIKDMGNYSLLAMNEAGDKKLTFSLEVLAKPLAFVNVKSLYGLNELATFTCAVQGFPPSNISWEYTKCPNLPSLADCERVDLQESGMVSEQSPAQQLASVETIVRMSGKINCTACNILGCDTAEQNILVSDGVTDYSFGVLQPPEPVTVEDEISVICAASVYNYTSVQWLDADRNPIETSDRVRITFETTDFTHRANLTITHVLKADGGVYYCEAITDEEFREQSQYYLSVEDPVPPYFEDVNLNETEVTISAREAHNSMNLRCHAFGMPKPTVTWYKNDQPLEFNEQQFFPIVHGQELIIKYFMEKDSGRYSCVARNRFGETSKYQDFVIKGPEISKVWTASIVGLLLILVVLLIYFCIRVRREKAIRKQMLEAGLMHFEEGALDCINPDLTVDDQAELLPYDRKWEFPRNRLKLGKQLGSGAFGVVMKAEARGIVADESATTVAVKMVRRNAEPAYIRALASELKIMVHLGKHLNVVNLLGACTNNIAKYELLVIVEYCRYGNLHNYLLRHRENFINQVDPATGKLDPSVGRDQLHRPSSISSNNRVKYAALSFSRSLDAANQMTITTECNGSLAGGTDHDTDTTGAVLFNANTQDVTGLPEGESHVNSCESQPGWRSNYRGDYKDRHTRPICTQDLLSWAFQVARGMEYLASRKVLHGDLAARNILLAENNVVKICDFGLAKTMYKDDKYHKKSDGPVPIKWMAIESIRDRVFSTQSDVWSFGIVLWEFFTLAETPYPGMEAEKQYQRLVEGYRMDQPKYATDDIYEIMLLCWRSSPSLRPSFEELVESIGELLEEGVKMHYVELNAPYMDLNTLSQDGKNDYLQMMSAPDHTNLASPNHEFSNNPTKPSDSAYLSMNSPLEESGDRTRFRFPSSPSSTFANATISDMEDAPMLQRISSSKDEPEEDDDNYLKPIDVHKKREEFMKQREAEKRRQRELSTSSSIAANERDSGYCNTPKGLDLIDAKLDVENNQRNAGNRFWGVSVDVDGETRPPENYVNLQEGKGNEIPMQQRGDVRDSFMNPSYIFVEAKKAGQTIV